MTIVEQILRVQKEVLDRIQSEINSTALTAPRIGSIFKSMVYSDSCHLFCLEPLFQNVYRICKQL